MVKVGFRVDAKKDFASTNKGRMRNQMTKSGKSIKSRGLHPNGDLEIECSKKPTKILFQ